MIWVRIVLTTHILRRLFSTIPTEPKGNDTQQFPVVVATLGQALRGGHEKSIAGKKFRDQFGNDANLNMLSLTSSIYLFKLCIYMPSSKNSSGVYRPKYKKKNALLACLAQRLSVFTSTCGTDTAGQGALEPPAEDGARTKSFDGEFQLRESHAEAETKKNC